MEEIRKQIAKCVGYRTNIFYKDRDGYENILSGVVISLDDATFKIQVLEDQIKIKYTSVIQIRPLKAGILTNQK